MCPVAKQSTDQVEAVYAEVRRLFTENRTLTAGTRTLSRFGYGDKGCTISLLPGELNPAARRF